MRTTTRTDYEGKLIQTEGSDARAVLSRGSGALSFSLRMSTPLLQRAHIGKVLVELWTLMQLVLLLMLGVVE